MLIGILAVPVVTGTCIGVVVVVFVAVRIIHTVATGLERKRLSTGDPHGCDGERAVRRGPGVVTAGPSVAVISERAGFCIATGALAASVRR